jgi:O-acetyl-ADP-ribose deacetylase (regulator of RNase III)
MFKNGEFPLIAHGANCVNTMEAGIALQLAENFPEVPKADKEFALPPLYRLGDYSIAQTEYGTVLNFYTQLEPGNNFEYSALKSCLKKLSMEAIESDSYIELAVPQIGSGIGGGDPLIIKRLLKIQEYLLITIVYYDKGEA